MDKKEEKVRLMGKTFVRKRGGGRRRRRCLTSSSRESEEGRGEKQLMKLHDAQTSERLWRLKGTNGNVGFSWP